MSCAQILNSHALYRIGRMALAIELGTIPDELPEDAHELIAQFKNPANQGTGAESKG